MCGGVGRPAADEHDPARHLLLYKPICGGRGQVVRAIERHVATLLPLVGGEFIQRGDWGHGRVGDDPIGCAQRLFDLRNPGGDCPGIRDVDHVKSQSLAESFDVRLQRGHAGFGVDEVADCHVGSQAGQFECNRPADVARAAADDRYVFSWLGHDRVGCGGSSAGERGGRVTLRCRGAQPRSVQSPATENR